MEKIKFYDLTPVNDVDLDIYKEAINYSLENDKIKNIAISGGYGAGKSSLLESYKIEEKDKRFLHISLSHFKELNNKDNENNETIAVANLEAKILNQLIHQIPEDAIPQTHFKIKRKFTNREIYLATSLVLIFGVALSHIIYFNKWKTFILKLKNISWLYKLFYFTTTEVFQLVSGIVLLFTFGIFIYKILKVQKTRNLFKKLNIQGNEIEISEDNNDSYFDKYLNEVLYLFEQVDVDVIVFEDIDRYEIGQIFGRLREINSLVNSHLKTKRKVLKFLYLLKDDIFVTKDRTKFFDFIIPIIPVMDSSNSYDKILDLFNEVYLSKLDKHFLQDISLYIDDMRLLKNIYNKFKIYYEKLKNTEINCNKMLGMIIYKNLFPRDFSNLHLNQGFVYNLFAQKEEFIKNELINLDLKIKKCKEEIEKIKTEHLKIDELNYVKKGKEKEMDGYYYESDKRKTEQWKWIENIYPERKKIIEGDKNSMIAGFQNQISKIEEDKKRLIDNTLKEIITRENINAIFELKVADELKNIEEFLEVKGNSYFKLLKYLIRSGYLDETYSDYMTYFYENSLSKEDKVFLRSVSDKERKEYSYKLKNPDLILERLRERDFEEIEILNFNLLENLLENDNEKDKLSVLLAQLKETKNFEFIREFFNLDIERDNFVKSLNYAWIEFFNELIERKIFLEEEIHNYSLISLYSSPKELLNNINVNDILKEYIETKEDYLKVETPNIDKLVSGFKELDVKFKKINYSLANKELFNEIYKNSMYELNFDNIELMLKKGLNINSDEEIKKKNYTLINNNRSSELWNYIEENINQYIEIILENCHSIEDNEMAVLEILNHENIIEENKIKYIEVLTTIILDISTIENKILWDKLLLDEKISYSEKNIILYFDDKKELNNILINFINLEKKELSFNNMENIISEEMVGKFFDYVIKCDSLRNNIYKNIIGTLRWEYIDGNIPENISEDKMNILIELKTIKMSSENLKKIRKNYEKNLNYFIEYNINTYIEIMEASLFSQEELLTILSNNSIEEGIKLKLLKFSEEAICIADKSYSINIQKYILENNYDVNDFNSLVKEYHKYDDIIKSKIFELIVRNIDGICSLIQGVSPELRESILISDQISDAKKLNILIELLNETEREKDFQKYLKIMNLSEYNNIFKKDSIVKIAKTDFNTKLLEGLKEKDFIESFNKDENEDIYNVVTKRKITEKIF